MQGFRVLNTTTKIYRDIHHYENIEMQNEADTFYADMLQPFCDAACINIRRPEEALIKRIVVSISLGKNVRPLHDFLFEGQHMDWKGVEEYLQDVRYSTTDWIRFIELLDFVNEGKYAASQQITDIITATLAGMKSNTVIKTINPMDSLRICFAKAGISMTWDSLCKGFILLNLSDVDSVTILDYLLSKLPCSETSTEILKHLPSVFRHEPQEYLEVFSTILQVKEMCHVRSHYIIQAIQAREDANERKRVKSQSVLHQMKKPSLTKILEQQQEMGLNNAHCDSFPAFCTQVRLTGNTSTRIKRILYFMKCLESHTHSDLETIIGKNNDLIENILAYVLITPDMHALKLFFDETHFFGEPFTALKLFRQICLPPTNDKVMNWSTIFRLYLCTFCKRDLIKDLWIYIWSGNRDYTQMIQTNETIEKYRKENQIQMDQVLRILIER